MIQSLGHVGLGVSNLEQSLKFYRDVMGMEVLMELTITDDRIARVTGIPGAQCRIVHLKLGDGILELFEYSNPIGINKAKDMRQCDCGLIHIGFEVNEFHKHVAQFKEMKLEFLGEPVEFRPGVWVVYLRGLDGEVVELRQRP
ncbi:MAG: VOC family protein [Phycisphaerae bacterium]|jgi:catechol 2,3-dioxygenase-like lactoylglutathione lyase family enzyme